MACSSTQENSSNKIYRRWLAETFDGQETADEEELTTDSLNGNKTVPPLRLAPFEPCIGMEFESAEDAREFYELYGRRLGFSIRNNRTRRSLKDNSIIGREFVCSKEGFRTGSSSSRIQKTCLLRPATREGCSAMIRITAKDAGKWVIYGFAKEHNHELNPTKMPPRRSHRIAFCEVCFHTSFIFIRNIILVIIRPGFGANCLQMDRIFSNEFLSLTSPNIFETKIRL